jgi:hypothetical protein
MARLAEWGGRSPLRGRWTRESCVRRGAAAWPGRSPLCGPWTVKFSSQAEAWIPDRPLRDLARDACAKTGRSGGGLVPGDPRYLARALTRGERPGPGAGPAVTGLQATRRPTCRGCHCPGRAGWSCPEPPAGATPSPAREPWSSGRDRGLRAAEVTNGRSDGGPPSPSIRERACLAWLRPARTARTWKEQYT